MQILYMVACRHGQGWTRVNVSDRTWAHARHDLEAKLLKTKKRHLWSYFAAVRDADFSRPYNPDKGLHAADLLVEGERIVLFRKPFPSALARIDEVEKGVYVPASVKRAQQIQGMSEDERIQYVQAVSLTTPTRHPADYVYVNGAPVPDASYVCRGCDVTGHHFRHDCPSGSRHTDGNVDGGGSRPLDRVQRPHGIPRSMLRKVDKTHKNAMVDGDGNYVVRAVRASAAPSRDRHSPPSPPQAAVCAQPDTHVDWMVADYFTVNGRVR